MSEPLVVGVDGSPTAYRAAEKARNLALSLRAPLHVVSAYTRDEITHVKSGADQWIISSADNALETAKQVVKALRTPELTIRAASAYGKPSEALIAYAEKNGAQMIVVGNRRMRGMARMLGSVANSVSHNATCDVYIANTDEN